MRFILLPCALLCGALPARAQVPDTVRADSAARARADSIARRDSLFLIREIERIRGEPRVVVDSIRPAAAGPANPRLLPDISALGDFIGDLSPDGSTQEGGTRLGIREIEIGIQAAVDPYFRGDVFLGLSDAEGIAIEEAYLTTSSLPWGLQARLGRFHMPVGKQNTIHRPELHTIEYPHVIQRFLGEEALKGTGVWLSAIVSPLGFYQELQVTAVDAFGGDAHGHEEEEVELVTRDPINEELSGLGYSARLRNYWDLSQAANVELSFSAATGKRAVGPTTCETGAAGAIDCPADLTAFPERQRLYGSDFTFRWRPLREGLYRSFIFQAEAFRRDDGRETIARSFGDTLVTYAAPATEFDGAYIFSRWQIGRRTYVGARFDWLEDPELGGTVVRAASGYLTFFPSEFSKLVAGYERVMPRGLDAADRVLLQATFALGPHRPHPF